MSFPSYPAYKESGVEWLGEVPFEWKVTPLKSIACVINGFPFDSKSFDTNEGFPLVRIRDLNGSSPDARYKGDFVDSAAISNDDVLIGMDGDFNVGRWLGEIPALLNQRMCCVRADTPMITRYLQYVLPAPLDAINKLTYATTVKHLSSFDVMKIRVAMPPDESCIAEVVSFLDHETAKIDALIAEQQRLIELLQEMRQAVISHAVTKGLNPDAPMKDSGVEWLGEVPEHWEVLRLRFAVTLNPSKQELNKLSEQELVSFLPMEAIGEDGSLRLEHEKQIEECLSGYTYFRDGDVCVAKITPCFENGKGAILRGLKGGIGFGTTELIVARPREGMITVEYLDYLFRSKVFRTHGESEMYGAGGQKRVPDSFVRDFVASLPSTDEQKQVTKFLDRETAKIDALKAEQKQLIELLKERRSALISAAVTGQIDVRGLVPEVAAA